MKAREGERDRVGVSVRDAACGSGLIFSAALWRSAPVALPDIAAAETRTIQKGVVVN